MLLQKIDPEKQRILSKRTKFGPACKSNMVAMAIANDAESQLTNNNNNNNNNNNFI